MWKCLFRFNTEFIGNLNELRKVQVRNALGCYPTNDTYDNKFPMSSRSCQEFGIAHQYIGHWVTGSSHKRTEHNTHTIQQHIVNVLETRRNPIRFLITSARTKDGRGGRRELTENDPLCLDQFKRHTSLKSQRKGITEYLYHFSFTPTRNIE